MVSNGILPTRDAASHALQLGTFLNPDMPGSFNEIFRDISKRAGHMAGTLAEREALPMSERFRGLCWITIPDDPSVGEWTPRPVYWTGTYWDDPTRRGRGMFIPRSLKTTVPTVGILGNTLTPIVNGTWFNAPGGSFNVDFSFSLDAANAAGMTLQGTQNGKTLREDYKDDIGKSTRNYTFTAYIDDHPGGDLAVQLAVLIDGTTGTVYTKGTGVRLTYLGPFLHG